MRTVVGHTAGRGIAARQRDLTAHPPPAPGGRRTGLGLSGTTPRVQQRRGPRLTRRRLDRLELAMRTINAASSAAGSTEATDSNICATVPVAADTCASEDGSCDNVVAPSD